MRKLNKYKKKIDYEKIINSRLILFLVIIIVLFTTLSIKIISVMVFEKDKYQKNLTKLNYSYIQGNSSPRGRIYDRNYNILVDNKSLKTIIYQKKKGVTTKEMIELANKVVNHIDVNYSKLTDRAKREYFFAKEKDYCNKLVTKKEIEKVKQRKMTQNELDELKINRIPEDKLNFSEEENKVAYMFYLMNKGYNYDAKIIKSDATDKEYA